MTVRSPEEQAEILMQLRESVDNLQQAIREKSKKLLGTEEAVQALLQFVGDSVENNQVLSSNTHESQSEKVIGFAGFLRQFRNRTGLSQEELQKTIGIDGRGYIAKIEAGDIKRPNQKFVDAFKVSTGLSDEQFGLLYNPSPKQRDIQFALEIAVTNFKKRQACDSPSGTEK